MDLKRAGDQPESGRTPDPGAFSPLGEVGSWDTESMNPRPGAPVPLFYRQCC